MKTIAKLLFLLMLSALISACGRTLQCNTYVIAQMQDKKISLPSANANGLDRYLWNSKDWARIARRPNGRLNHDAAYKAAKAKKTVLVTYNPGNKRSGHIAIVYGKKKPVWSNGFKANVPYVQGSVQGRKPSLNPLSAQFSADKEPKMTYYLYKK